MKWKFSNFYAATLQIHTVAHDVIERSQGESVILSNRFLQSKEFTLKYGMLIKC